MTDSMHVAMGIALLVVFNLIMCHDLDDEGTYCKHKIIRKRAPRRKNTPRIG